MSSTLFPELMEKVARELTDKQRRKARLVQGLGSVPFAGISAPLLADEGTRLSTLGGQVIGGTSGAAGGAAAGAAAAGVATLLARKRIAQRAKATVLRTHRSKVRAASKDLKRMRFNDVDRGKRDLHGRVNAENRAADATKLRKLRTKLRASRGTDQADERLADHVTNIAAGLTVGGVTGGFAGQGYGGRKGYEHAIRERKR